VQNKENKRNIDCYKTSDNSSTQTRDKHYKYVKHHTRQKRS